MFDDPHGAPEVIDILPIFPLPNAVLLPGVVLPLNVFEPRYLDLVDFAREQGTLIGIPLLRPGFEPNYLARPAVEEIFGVGRLLSHQRLPDGRRFIRVEGQRRGRLEKELEVDTSFRQVKVKVLPEDHPSDRHQLEVLEAQLERIAVTLRADDQQLVQSVLRIPDRRALVYAVAAIVPTLGVLADTCESGRSVLLDLQQRCLAAESTDARVGELLDVVASICDVLSDTGRFPRSFLN